MTNSETSLIRSIRISKSKFCIRIIRTLEDTFYMKKEQRPTGGILGSSAFEFEGKRKGNIKMRGNRKGKSEKFQLKTKKNNYKKRDVYAILKVTIK